MKNKGVWLLKMVCYVAAGVSLGEGTLKSYDDSDFAARKIKEGANEEKMKNRLRKKRERLLDFQQRIFELSEHKK